MRFLATITTLEQRKMARGAHKDPADPTGKAVIFDYDLPRWYLTLNGLLSLDCGDTRPTDLTVGDVVSIDITRYTSQ